MVRRKSTVSAPGLRDDVLQVLCVDRFQTMPCISAQVIVPPEAAHRRYLTRGNGATVRGAGNAMVNVRLRSLVRAGLAERRKNANGRWEYRLRDPVSDTIDNQS